MDSYKSLPLCHSSLSPGKHVNQWVSEKGLKASFLDRHAVLQQVLNTMAAIHNGGSDKSLWGCFMGKWRKREGMRKRRGGGEERERDKHTSEQTCIVCIHVVPLFICYTLECSFIVITIFTGVLTTILLHNFTKILVLGPVKHTTFVLFLIKVLSVFTLLHMYMNPMHEHLIPTCT